MTPNLVFLVTIEISERAATFAKEASLGTTQTHPKCITCHEGFDGQHGTPAGHHAIGMKCPELAASNRMLRSVEGLPAQDALYGGVVTCQTGHGLEPHEGKRLVIENRGSDLCSACHLM